MKNRRRRGAKLRRKLARIEARKPKTEASYVRSLVNSQVKHADSDPS